ncbi:MAG: xanthine dehydrogenase family protein molybdopterin-binding subunit [Ferruginibacter sp.]
MPFFDNDFDNDMPAEGRVEAVAKVTGRGKYSAEYEAGNICYAVLVGSSIAAGKIEKIDTATALLADGVIDIITHTNKPLVPGLADEAKIKEARIGLPVFHTDSIYFKGQPIAMVVAGTLEEATYAASLVKTTYAVEKFNVDFNSAYAAVPLKDAGRERGSLEAWANAGNIVEQEYHIKSEVHNPMEMHASIAEWTAADKLKLYDKNQGVNNVQNVMAKLFAIPAKNIEVISEYVGGGFGSGLRVWPNTIAAVMAAKKVNRPVKLMLTRPQMFYSVGYRPEAWQKLKLGADASGKFLGALHQSKNTTSVYENFEEGITRISRLIYRFDNLKTQAATVPLNLSTPTWMRAPGECTGAFALESAIDELSYQLQIDPVALRLKNIASDKDPESGKPWSTHYLQECIEKGAVQINWQQRPAAHSQLKEGDWQIGYGMAVGMWTAGRGNASAGIAMQKDGSITVKTAMTDIGTGTGVSIQNIAHDKTNLSLRKIKVELGQSSLPPAPSQGGSRGLSTISAAIVAVCDALKLKLSGYAAQLDTAYRNAKAEDIFLTDDGIALKEQTSFISYKDLFTKNNIEIAEAEASAAPGEENRQYAFCSAAAHFCKVRVHARTGKVKVEKFVAVADGGAIVSEKPAANQMSGAVTGGIGMALMEEMGIDTKLGGLIANDLAGYHFAVNADTPIVEVQFINKPDYNINPSGAKGLGEVGIIGSAAAIANAIYHATGKRMRSLPITPDKVLTATVS